jgi:hypothetical protein
MDVTQPQRHKTLSYRSFNQTPEYQKQTNVQNSTQTHLNPRVYRSQSTLRKPWAATFLTSDARKPTPPTVIHALEA